MTLKPRLGLFEVIEHDAIQSDTYDFLFTFHSNHRPISHRFRDKQRFLSKIAKFFHPTVYLTPPLNGLPLEFAIGARCHKSTNDGATRWSKKFSDRFSCLDTIPAVTDRRTHCRSKDRDMMCFARVKSPASTLNDLPLLDYPTENIENHSGVDRSAHTRSIRSEHRNPQTFPISICYLLEVTNSYTSKQP